MSSYSEGLCNIAFFFAKREEEFCFSVFLIEIPGGENSKSASGEQETQLRRTKESKLIPWSVEHLIKQKTFIYSF